MTKQTKSAQIKVALVLDLALALALALDKGRAQAQVLDQGRDLVMDKEIVVLDNQVDQIRMVKVKVQVQEMVAEAK